MTSDFHYMYVLCIVQISKKKLPKHRLRQKCFFNFDFRQRKELLKLLAAVLFHLCLFQEISCYLLHVDITRSERTFLESEGNVLLDSCRQDKLLQWKVSHLFLFWQQLKMLDYPLTISPADNGRQDGSNRWFLAPACTLLQKTGAHRKNYRVQQETRN